MHHQRSRQAQRAFTLIELVVTLGVASLITVIIAELISRPVTAYMNTSLRTQLVDTADSALREMRMQLSQSLPNSIRIGCGGACLEFLHVRQKGFYRALPPGNFLSFLPFLPDLDGFESLGGIQNPTDIQTGTNGSDCRQGLADCLVINHTGLPGLNAFDHDNIATITNIDAGTGEIDYRFEGSQVVFPSVSLDQNYYIVDSPVSFLCNVGGDQTLRQYQNYPIISNQTNIDTHAELVSYGGTESGILANKITVCEFDYQSITGSEQGLVSVRLEVSQQMPSGHTESITLFNQIRVGE